MATVNARVCDVSGKTAGVERFRVTLRPETKDGAETSETLPTVVDEEADLCPQAVEKLATAIHRRLVKQTRKPRANKTQDNG